MNTSKTFLVFVAVLLLLVQVQGFYLPLSKRDNPSSASSMVDPKKRPFCNAFTGCGRKRTNIPPLASSIREGSSDEESIGTLFELSAEPAVEDLSRQIMSEAKLWEAIREANEELTRQKQKYAMESEEAIPARSATASCALPPCII
ncbi:cardioactive peptide [Agrilus planipennis]|uniref:Cardioactive peptide n=1 Tax=Agrilus planipennis TaxID=224129 RepID=A0A7F5R4U4_AGRPL|nr:cardioactive peptide [Agrilus planipennis]